MSATRGRRLSRAGRMDGPAPRPMSSLRAGDLGEDGDDSRRASHGVQAINRQVSHYSAHVGQIVLLAKHFAGAAGRR